MQEARPNCKPVKMPCPVEESSGGSKVDTCCVAAAHLAVPPLKHEALVRRAWGDSPEGEGHSVQQLSGQRPPRVLQQRVPVHVHRGRENDSDEERESNDRKTERKKVK